MNVDEKAAGTTNERRAARGEHEAVRARDIMTEDVGTVVPDAQVAEVARVLLRYRISALPVVEADGRLAGIVSEGDLLRRAETGTERHPSWWLALLTTAEDTARDYVKTQGRRVADAMSRDVVTVGEDTPVEEIARLLEERRIKRVPVVRRDRRGGPPLGSRALGRGTPRVPDRRLEHPGRSRRRGPPRPGAHPVVGGVRARGRPRARPQTVPASAARAR